MRSSPSWVSRVTPRVVTRQVVMASGSLKTTEATPSGPVLTSARKAAVSVKYWRRGAPPATTALPVP